ncbi:carboxylesterase/lipase family protein [Silvibacterium acidisoli]|uniref:carboxylesterase/lipase family protein n=1 Tax=Acidobacteriaceae bacterium ZG23-2 TaxID=2883246 RepID=UPI00406BF51C
MSKSGLAVVSRRSFLLSASAALASQGLNPRLFAAPLLKPDEHPIVETALGKVQGVLSDNSRIFKGIPFAAPPIGTMRFHPPAAAQPWKGVRPAVDFPNAAMQPPTAYPISEDCLYLNIWAPEAKGTYPVFVYIHGGGFTGGRSFEPIFNGTQFAKNGIVCVTVAYRLGSLGFLDVGPLLGSQYAGAANNAMRDLVSALEWVQKNIAAFGGDPKQVTIGGESAGAKLTCLLMGVPAAQGLFHGMISESGGAERIWPADNAARVAHGYNDVWTKTGSKTGDLLTADAAALVAAQRVFIRDWPQHFPLRAEIDGTFVPQTPIRAIQQGSSHGKRLLIGTNRDESALFIGPHPAKDAAAADLGNISVEQFEPVYKRYAKVYPDMTVEQRRIRAVTAEEYWIPSVRVADAHVGGGGEAYMYRLDFSETDGRLSGYAYHSLDNVLVWNYPHKTAANAEAEAMIASQMHNAWAAFIKGGAPAASGLPQWPRYTTQDRATMILDTQSHVDQKPAEQELRLWDGVM